MTKILLDLQKKPNYSWNLLNKQNNPESSKITENYNQIERWKKCLYTNPFLPNWVLTGWIGLNVLFSYIYIYIYIYTIYDIFKSYHATIIFFLDSMWIFLNFTCCKHHIVFWYKIKSHSVQRCKRLLDVSLGFSFKLFRCRHFCIIYGIMVFEEAVRSLVY